ncbi:HAMP domain-containing sensor histidine kinase [Inediibacterium massiliense]|uniref:HAMP domain-containing sensor histidine kinase n=1 Tax=Inediibacterium massiliense TaxID=1658111 RepID=UPI0006B60130|nr:HAMP domain-containing sensor histidine kinase [Inediibacterium massiliense]
MKWKLTFSFVISIVLIVVLVLIMNITAIFFLIAHKNTDDLSHSMKDGVYFRPEGYVRNFQRNIYKDQEKIDITEDAKKSLMKNHAWIQILDENGKEVYQYQKEKTVPIKYNPMDLIHYYKYAKPSTVLVGEKSIDGYRYSYLIGFPYEMIDKQVFIYNKDYAGFIFKNGLMLIIGIDILLALLFGLYFSSKLTEPVKKIIQGIEYLGSGNYRINYEERGLYKEVYSNMNHLGDLLEESEQERKELDLMREEWLSNISHDIKTPLSSIRGYAELLDSGYDFTNEEVKEYAQIIEKKAIYIKELVDDLNLSTRLKNKKISPRLEDCNLVSFLREIVIDFLNTSENRDTNIDFISDLEEIQKRIDPVLFKRVIHNIISNAIVHNDRKVNITVRIKKGKDKLMIFIEDDGKGIKEEDIKHIFTRYYRGTNTSKDHEGSGLGMAIAKDIITIHGGNLSVQSKIGYGTTFQIIM